MNKTAMHVAMPSAETRLRIYKEVVELLEAEELYERYLLDEQDGLCLWLMCALYDVNYYDVGMDFELAPMAFPEFGEYYPSNSYVRKPKYRIKILKEIIQNMQQ